MLLSMAGDCSAPLPLLYARACHVVPVSALGAATSKRTSVAPWSSISVRDPSSTLNVAAWARAAKYACSWAIASSGPAMSVAAACAMVIPSGSSVV